MTRLAALLAAVAALALLGACGTTGEDDTTAAEEVASEATETGTSTGGSAAGGGADQPLSPDQEQGKELFVSNCGSCHPLDAAGTQGQVGPNLDEAQVDREEVLAAIRNGGLGSGTMPANLVTGEDAQDVAAFVAGENPAPGD